MSSKMTDEQLKETKKIADDIAKTTVNSTTGETFKDIKDLQNTANDLMRSSNIVEQQRGMEIARGAVKDLLLLCLYQQIEGNKLPGYMDFANKFDDGYIENGNSKQYMFSNDTGVDSYQETEFVPSAVTNTSVDSFIIQMYSAGGVLNANQAYQFRKPKSITEAQWIPYFKAGKLAEFIGILRNEIHRVYSYYKFNKIATKITTSTPAKTIEGTATNMFDCFVKEVLPTIREMTTLNSKFNYDVRNKNLTAAAPEDLMLIANGKVITQLSAGIKTQLFNQQLLDYHNLLDSMNIVNLGNKIVVPEDVNTPISVEDTPYVDEETIWIVHKDALKHVLQIDRTESQSFAANMVIQLYLHVWGALDILPWGQIVKYHNANLMTMPE